MSRSGPIAELGLACPSGGNFYICQGNSTQFIGCCSTDPCADGAGSCPQVNLEPATFNKLDYQGIAAQSCTDAKAAWYLCSALSTPFMGCCLTDACSNTAGCPQSDLVAAMLGNATEAQVFLTTTASAASTTKTATGPTSVSSATSDAATTTTGASAAGTAAGTAEIAMSDSPAIRLSTGAQAGIGLGAAAALIVLAGLLVVVIRRTLNKRRDVVIRGSEPPSPSTVSIAPTSGFADPDQTIYNAQLPGGLHEPRWPARAAEYPYSIGSSPSTGYISRETSVRSAASHNVVGNTISGSPAEGRPYESQLGHKHRPLDTLAELDGSCAFPSPVISEMDAPTLPTTRPSVPFRPYRPSH